MALNQTPGASLRVIEFPKNKIVDILAPEVRCIKFLQEIISRIEAGDMTPSLMLVSMVDEVVSDNGKEGRLFRHLATGMTNLEAAGLASYAAYDINDTGVTTLEGLR